MFRNNLTKIICAMCDIKKNTNEYYKIDNKNDYMCISCVKNPYYNKKIKYYK
ncbi:hypothetical protein AHEV_071 [Adoxophyes honmai entomopoxvirus 'L']|uniref:Uncharacterized protein n=1 Tax=Adoxophyes honmai entomopoxvirus 'L' TaxID=1293540 RepID=A0A916NWQ7_9POXV|nr:hypothetical protein AHEV_071 [Adoxophyes honmai entomopoxvirus 'L']CCU55392.1 hypothetical protein AHEV_071 [Adoxophyes honmai entomopoxvirus 'L']